MGNPSILGRVDTTPHQPVARWTPTAHNGILGWIDGETDHAARALLPPIEAEARGAKRQVVVQHPEIGAVRMTFEVKRASGRYKGARPFWAAVFAEKVKEKPLEGG